MDYCTYPNELILAPSYTYTDSQFLMPAIIRQLDNAPTYAALLTFLAAITIMFVQLHRDRLRYLKTLEQNLTNTEIRTTTHPSSTDS